MMNSMKKQSLLCLFLSSLPLTLMVHCELTGSTTRYISACRPYMQNIGEDFCLVQGCVDAADMV